MDARRAAAIDDATVALLRETSWKRPSDVLRDCAHCGKPFWAHASPGRLRRYCELRCRVAAAYYRRRLCVVPDAYPIGTLVRVRGDLRQPAGPILRAHIGTRGEIVRVYDDGTYLVAFTETDGIKIPLRLGHDEVMPEPG